MIERPITECDIRKNNIVQCLKDAEITVDDQTDKV